MKIIEDFKDYIINHKDQHQYLICNTCIDSLITMGQALFQDHILMVLS